MAFGLNGLTSLSIEGDWRIVKKELASLFVDLSPGNANGEERPRSFLDVMPDPPHRGMPRTAPILACWGVRSTLQ